MASLKASNILIFGATGFIGQHITQQIITAQPAFGSITIFTSPDTVANKASLLESWKQKASLAGTPLHITAGSVDSESDVRGAYTSQAIDTVVSAFGRGAIAKQANLITWAAAEPGVQWFFPSEYGTDIEYGPQSAGEKPHQQKLAVRKLIREEVAQHGDLHVTYVVTGPYFESWVPFVSEQLPGYDVERKTAVVTDDGEGRIGFTTMPDVGRLVVAALRRPEVAALPAAASGGGGKALKVHSFETTPKEVLGVYERLTGGEKWAVKSVPLSQMKEAEDKAWAEGDAKATVLTLRRIWAEGGTLYEKTDNEALGITKGDLESLEAVITRLLAKE
ncbi:hypothetical protein BD289DRAFT_486476 [Coniella lustricola]|uniref:NmrA-like domain-containing protein n=1 Tax=Coniella lustricola TaxID=2025994 RepID=A0A2T2ZV15_9PEZI|nr:hypothetical protein BD289DRAFT_486476 [Coniella lustricola]